LKGSVGVGYIMNEEYVMLNLLKEGDFFGEVTALTGVTRTANVITEEESEFLIIPSGVIHRLAKQYNGLRRVLYSTIAQCLSRIELPRSVSVDQQLLRELRTNVPGIEEKQAPL
jgi:CRP-like cAMP-binding protein